MKHKSILFVSPGGTSFKAIKVKVFSVFIVVLLSRADFQLISFLPKIPSQTVEVKQKQRLSVQNEVLQQRIVSALGMLNRLRQQSCIWTKKKSV